MQNFNIIAQESLVLGIKNRYTPNVKRIRVFAFCLYKTSYKSRFLYINVNKNDSYRAKDNVQVFIYTKIETKLRNVSKYIQNPENLQKGRQCALRYYSQKSRQFRLHGFS